MSNNKFGKIFNFTTWGESHGLSIGCVVDGVPSNISLNEKDIQNWLEKRRPGKSKFTTQRKESDKVRILSGTFEGLTTGAPISLIIDNEDQRSKDYEEIKDIFRPGHADYTYQMKYGIRDYRGGGRASARETAMRVAAGGIARKILDSLSKNKFKITGYLTQIGDSKIDYKNWDENQIEENNLFCPDKSIVSVWEEKIDNARKNGSSIGAIIEIKAKGIPVGLGEPIYSKLDSDLAKAMMSINAVKGVEIGNGFESVLLSGEDNIDEIRSKNNEINFMSNKSGGILGGISTGQEIVLRFCVKPTSSILKSRKTVDKNYQEIDINIKGRHDPCVGIRAVPVGEAMMAATLADHWLRMLATKIA
ncbi:MAG: chorismate synthase [Pelagibacteraceae bacterium]|nr:chorismate synthase [Pelagibacteraceae bacterium]|tara:strand:- start:33418 stop:34503 length:1086 start_codon:yes stop_codon:yes gene_type:complete